MQTTALDGTIMRIQECVHDMVNSKKLHYTLKLELYHEPYLAKGLGPCIIGCKDAKKIDRRKSLS